MAAKDQEASLAIVLDLENSHLVCVMSATSAQKTWAALEIPPHSKHDEPVMAEG